jgi:transposase
VTTADVEVTGTVHQVLAARDLLPAEHFVDSAYPDADILVQSQAQVIDLVGPVHRDTSWQARAGAGFDLACFTVDWEAQHVRCPQGQTSRVWSSSHDAFGHEVMHIQFDTEGCGTCGERPACTNAAVGPRTRKLRPQAQHDALQAARTRQETAEFKQQHVFVTLTLNLSRLLAWWAEQSKAQTRSTRFSAALRHAEMTPLLVT